MITALLLSKGMDTKEIVYNLSFAVVIGGALQLFVHLIMIKKLKLDRLFRVGYLKIKRGKSRIDEDIKRFKKGFLASILGGSTAQISAFIDGILASFLTAGSISYLYYANRVFQFPLAIFAIATSVAIFPKVAKYLNQNKEKEAREMLDKSFWILLYLLSFATVVGIVFAKEIVWLLLERGAFSHHDTIMSSKVLVMYLVGLIPFGLAKIFSLWLYSTHNQAKAAKISAISLGVNIILALILVRYLKVEGLALAGSLGGFVLFSLTIKHFGIKNFLDILSLKKLGVFIVFITTSIMITLYLKGFISGYIQ
jgi:putative peptidoglycan lipid II flippase